MLEGLLWAIWKFYHYHFTILPFYHFTISCLSSVFFIFRSCILEKELLVVANVSGFFTLSLIFRLLPYWNVCQMFECEFEKTWSDKSVWGAVGNVARDDSLPFFGFSWRGAWGMFLLKLITDEILRFWTAPAPVDVQNLNIGLDQWLWTVPLFFSVDILALLGVYILPFE